MNLPPRVFYSLTEISARWGCPAPDIAGWTVTDHLTLVTSIAAVNCGKQPVAGIVEVSEVALDQGPTIYSFTLGASYLNATSTHVCSFSRFQSAAIL